MIELLLWAGLPASLRPSRAQAVQSEAGRPRPVARLRATLDSEHGVVPSNIQQARPPLTLAKVYWTAHDCSGMAKELVSRANLEQEVERVHYTPPLDAIRNACVITIPRTDDEMIVELHALWVINAGNFVTCDTNIVVRSGGKPIGSDV